MLQTTVDLIFDPNDKAATDSRTDEYEYLEPPQISAHQLSLSTVDGGRTRRSYPQLSWFQIDKILDDATN
jgi:hypothetical protein